MTVVEEMLGVDQCLVRSCRSSRHTKVVQRPSCHPSAGEVRVVVASGWRLNGIAVVYASTSRVTVLVRILVLMLLSKSRMHSWDSWSALKCTVGSGRGRRGVESVREAVALSVEERWTVAGVGYLLAPGFHDGVLLVFSAVVAEGSVRSEGKSRRYYPRIY